MIALDLVYQAILDLYERDQNDGDWSDGIPKSFLALGTQIGAIGKDEGWVLVVEGYVRRRAIALLAGKIRAEEWLEDVDVPPRADIRF